MKKVTPINRGYAPGEKVKLDGEAGFTTEESWGVYLLFLTTKEKEKMNNDEEYLE